MTFESFPVGEYYLHEKTAKLPFVGYGKRTTKIFASRHIDMWSPFDVQAKDGYLYFIILSMIFHGMDICIRHKFEVFEKFKNFKYKIKK